MPQAKFGPDPLKTVTVSKEQRNAQIEFLANVNVLRYVC